MSNMEQVIKDLQDTLIVISEIERRQSTLPREHGERNVRLEAESLEFRRRTEQNLAEITEKLNRLTGYGGGMNPPRSQ